MAMAMAMGKYFALQSSNNLKFLELQVTKLRMVIDDGLNKFTGETPVPFGLYKMEKVKTGSGLVHIKCCSNNKYWVQRGKLITSTADKPQADTFEILPMLGCGIGKIRIRHVKTGQLLCHVKTGQLLCHSVHDPCLIINPEDKMDGQYCYDFIVYGGQILKDGTDTGINSCNFKYETKEEKKAACDLIEQLATEAI